MIVKTPTSAVKPMQPSFYLQMISKTQRERERERERAQVAIQPSSDNPDHATPTAQIMPPHHPDRASQASAPPPRSRQPSFLIFLSSSSTLLLPLAQRCQSSCHQPPAHYIPTLNPPSAPVSLVHCLSPTTSPHLRSTHLHPVVTLPHANEAIPA